MTQKQIKITGQIVTGIFSALLVMSGVAQMMASEPVVAHFHHLGFDNLLVIRFMAALKIAAAVGFWVPRGRPWAVHGCTFLFCGAIATHIGAGDAPTEMIGAAVALVFVATSEFCAIRSSQPAKAGATRTRRAA